MTTLSENARRVFDSRYALRDADGSPREDFDGMCARVSAAVAAAEALFGGDVHAVADRFERMLRRREFLPNSPTLMNAATGTGQLAACFVLPVEDSLPELFETVKRIALVQQSGGGTGFSLSALRPAGDVVGQTPGVAAGPLRFLEVFDAVAGTIRQGARRQGANMGVLAVSHPDIVEFVRAKERPDHLQNFNLSVAVPDSFFAALDSGADVALTNPRDAREVGRMKASELLDQMAMSAWSCGDPGVLFSDHINRANATPRLGPLEATNPCGELPLLPNESCNLGSLRLDAFVRPGAGGGLDLERLGDAVQDAVRFLDDVVECNAYPLPEIEALSRANRKLGLGVMGFADLLVDQGIAYDSAEAVNLAESVMGFIQARAETASARLAEERGVFENFPGSRAEARGLRLRNATLTSVAPTGSLSLLADCSAGIEPYFALAFGRNILDGEHLVEVNGRLERALRDAGCASRDVLDEVTATGKLRGILTLPESIRRLFGTALEIEPAWHLRIQAAFQRQVDNAVSKTINLPESASPQDVRAIYREAWRRSLKGVTVFREGCRTDSVLVRGTDGVAEARGRCDAC